MKKRIIAALLLLVMTVLTLASCGFDICEEDLTQYTDGKFDVKAFMEALKNIEIEDAEYTTNKEINDKFVNSDIYDGLASAVISNIGAAGESDDKEGKLEDGIIGERDVVYYCYYISYTDNDGKLHEFKRSELNEDTMSVSATKANHVINLGKFNTQDKFAIALAEALKGKELKTYNTSTGSVKKDSTVLVSYTVETKDGESTTTEQASYQLVDISGESVLAKEIAKLFKEDGTFVTDATIKVGSAIEFPLERVEENKANSSKTVEVDLGNGKTAKYSNVIINCIIDKAGEEIVINDFELDKDLGDLAFNELHNSKAETTSAKLEEGTKVNYHIFPVYRVEIPEVSAEAIIEYVYGEKLESLLETPASTFAYGSTVNKALNAVLQSEEFKNGDNTVKSLTESLVKLWEDDFSENETLKKLADDVKTADDAYEKVLDAEDEAKAKYEAAKKISDASKKAMEAAETAWNDAAEADKADKKAAYDEAKAKYETDKKATDDAKKAYDDAKDVSKEKKDALEELEEKLEADKKTAIKAKIAEITAAKKDETALSDEFVKELKDEIAHSRKEEYNSEIKEKIEEEVFKLVNDMVTVTSYPEKLVEEFRDHIYDEYENTFYTGKYSSSSSDSKTNYSYYNGDFNAFLKAQTKASNNDGIDKAITEQAEGYIEPLIKIFVVAKALDSYDFSAYGYGNTADAVLTKFVELDIAAGLYNANVFYDDSISEEENEEYKKYSEENAETSRENALELSANFFIDKDGFKAYKKMLGAKSYRYQKQTYGETNLKANLQISNLFDLLLSTNQTVNVVEEDKHVHTEVNYVDGLLDYRLIEYKIVENKDAEADAE